MPKSRDSLPDVENFSSEEQPKKVERRGRPRKNTVESEPAPVAINPELIKRQQAKDAAELAEAREELENPEFFAALKEMGEEVKRDRCCYAIQTKIKPGDKFMGVTEDASGGEGNAIYRGYRGGSSKMSENFFRGSDPSPLMDFYLDSQIRYGKERTNIAIVPLIEERFAVDHYEKKTETKIEEKPFLFFFKKKVETKKEISVPVKKRQRTRKKMKDVGGQGEDEVVGLNFSYDCPEYVREKGGSIRKGREGTTFVTILMSKELAEKMVNGVKENPENFWKILNAMNPDLLKKSPPQEKGRGVHVYQPAGTAGLDQSFASLGINRSLIEFEPDKDVPLVPWKEKE